jgi:hypothetical protein
MKIEVPQSIELNRPDKYALAIVMHPERWSFMIFDLYDGNSCFFFEDHPEILHDGFASFKDLYFENDFFSLPFGKIYAVRCSADFTFVPDEINIQKHGREFLEYMSSERGGLALYNSVKELGFSVVYRIPEAVCDFLSRSFADIEFIHYSSPLIAVFAQRENNSRLRRMVIGGKGKEISLICFDCGRFLMFNNYTAGRLQDALYYILFTWKQLKFSQCDDAILLFGDAAKDEELIKTLKEYIGRVETLPVSTEATIHKALTGDFGF